MIHTTFIAIGITVFLFYKSERTYKNHMYIVDAISDYRTDCWENKITPQVDYDDIEPYSITMFRLWDFGYENILSKSKYELIKKFIKK